MNNRIWNAKNPHQGGRKKALAICSAGLLRSPTIAHVLMNDPFNMNARSVGCEESFALIPIDQVLVDWADILVFADAQHKMIVDLGYNTSGKQSIVLGIPDVYRTFDLELMKIIYNRLREELEID